MAVFAVSITKEVAWRGGPQEFSNVYHFGTVVGQAFDDLAVIDKVVSLERAIHANTITFKTARSWGPTEQGQAASKMREVKQLSGVGTAIPTTSFYPEFAILIQWPLGRYGIRNHPQYLRKWLHLGRSIGLPMTGERTAWAGPPQDVVTYVNAIRHLDPGILDTQVDLITADGEHKPTQDGVIYPYLEHRQLGS